MGGLIFDYTDGDVMYGAGGYAVDSEGHIGVCVGSNTLYDLDSGEMHWISSWNDDANDDSDCYDNGYSAFDDYDEDE